MTHQDIRERLDDYVDGTLSEAEIIEIEAHLEACAECSRVVEETRSLLEQARSTLGSIEPCRDLWPGIATRISGSDVVSIRDGKSSRRITWARQPVLAAAAVIAVVVTTMVVIRTQWEQQLIREENAVVIGILAEFDQVDAESEAAGKTLFAGFQGESGKWAGKILGAMGKNIQVVDGAIGDLRSALQRDPMDTGLVHKLRREYQRKSALIRQTAHLLDQVATVGQIDSLT